jgi:hypothetical protein
MFFEPRAILLAGWFISTVYAKAKSANNSLYPVSSYQLSVRRLLILGTLHPDPTTHNTDRLSTVSLFQEVFPRYGTKPLPLTRSLRAEKCPPCFNCMLPAFTCGQYGECDPYNGQCNCPPGWGGIDCLTPRKCPYVVSSETLAHLRRMRLPRRWRRATST